MIDAYFDKEIRILVSDPGKVSMQDLKATLAEHDINPSKVSLGRSI